MNDIDLSERLLASLPPEFDAQIYHALYPDLKHLSGPQLHAHWERHGIREGRRGHGITDRDAFARLIPEAASLLEVGPFYNPVVSGPNVRYLDMLDRDQLIARAIANGYPTERVPEVHYVARDGTLSLVEDRFDVVISSHVIEHQPDLIRHLDDVKRILHPGGLYFVLAPDRRYCFDYFIAESTLAQVLEAHDLVRKRPSLRSQLEHAALRTHNDHRRHWQGDHGLVTNTKERLMEALASFEAEPDGYVDVHSWYFTVESFRTIMASLRKMELSSLELLRLYPTLQGNNEFWAIFRAPGH